MNEEWAGDKYATIDRFISTSVSKDVAKSFGHGSNNIFTPNSWVDEMGEYDIDIPTPTCIIQYNGVTKGLAVSPLAKKEYHEELEVLIGAGNNEVKFTSAEYDEEDGIVTINFEDIPK